MINFFIGLLTADIIFNLFFILGNEIVRNFILGDKKVFKIYIILDLLILIILLLLKNDKNRKS